MRLKKRIARLLVLAVLLSALVVLPTPAQAAPGQALCIVQLRTSVDPPFSLTTVHASFLTSNGNTGSASCIGTAEGSEIIGPGTASMIGIASGNCLQGEVLAKLSITVPTKAGPVSDTVPFKTPYLAGLGSLAAPSFNGTYLFTPSIGDCTLVLASDFTFTFIGGLTV